MLEKIWNIFLLTKCHSCSYQVAYGSKAHVFIKLIYATRKSRHADKSLQLSSFEMQRSQVNVCIGLNDNMHGLSHAQQRIIVCEINDCSRKRWSVNWSITWPGGTDKKVWVSSCRVVFVEKFWLHQYSDCYNFQSKERIILISFLYLAQCS